MSLSADDVGAVLARQPLNKGKSPEQLRDYWVASKTFRLQEVPLNAIGTATEIEPGARSRTKAPIIVDLNQNQVGRLRDAEGRTYGAPPDALVLDGKHRVAEALGRGDATIMAYVGDRVAGLLKKAMQQHQAMKSKIEDLTERYLASDTPGGTLRELRQLLSADEVERLRKRWKELHRSSAATSWVERREAAGRSAQMMRVQAVETYRSRDEEKYERERRAAQGLGISGELSSLVDEIEQLGGIWEDRTRTWYMPDQQSIDRLAKKHRFEPRWDRNRNKWWFNSLVLIEGPAELTKALRALFKRAWAKWDGKVWRLPVQKLNGLRNDLDAKNVQYEFDEESRYEGEAGVLRLKSMGPAQEKRRPYTSDQWRRMMDIMRDVGPEAQERIFKKHGLPPGPLSAIKRMKAFDQKQLGDLYADFIQETVRSRASVEMKRAVIAELLRARQPRLANAVAMWVAAKLMPVQEALNWLDMDAEKLGDPAVLKKAYRDASMKHHPDRGGTKEAMQKVNEAYEVLRKQKGGFRSPADRAEQELKVDQAATIMEQGLRTAFNEQKFTDHIEKATGKKFNATSKITRDKTYYGYTIRLFAEWKSEDGLTTFELRAWADAERFNWGPRQLGAGGQDYSFQISAYSRIFHETRKVKFKQSDWAASSDSRVVLDPKSMFPAPKIKAMMGGKEKQRKFSRRDMLLGLEKLLGAKTWGSGKDTYVNVPLGKDNKFTLQMARSTMMGQAMWIPTGRASISEGNPGLRSTVQHPIGSYQDIPEFEGSLLALKDLQKKTANMEDGKQVAEAVKRMLQQLRNDWQAGKLA